METQQSVVALAQLQADVKRLQSDMEALIRSNKALVDAWTTATGVVRFVKLMSTFIAAVTAIWLFVRHGIAPKAG